MKIMGCHEIMDILYNKLMKWQVDKMSLHQNFDRKPRFVYKVQFDDTVSLYTVS
jgi:hypothetical protein